MWGDDQDDADEAADASEFEDITDARLDTPVARILIKTRADAREWIQWGKCKGMADQLAADPRLTADEKLTAQSNLTDLFYPTRHSTTQQIQAAKAICHDCAVTAECLASSCVYWEKVGIWGGKTEMERRIIRRAMRSASVCSPSSLAAAVQFADDHYGD